MRYLICILIMALTVPAIGQLGPSSCPSSIQISAESDYNLPVFTDWYCVDHDSVSWTFDFTRTSNPSESTEIIAFIDGEFVILPADSRKYAESRRYRIAGKKAVASSFNRLRIEASPGSTLGHFVDIVFRVIYFD